MFQFYKNQSGICWQSWNTLRPINLVHNKFGYHNFGHHNFRLKFRRCLVYNNFSPIFQPPWPFSCPLTRLLFRFLARYSHFIRPHFIRPHFISKIVIFSKLRHVYVIMSKQNVEVLTWVKFEYFQCRALALDWKSIWRTSFHLIITWQLQIHDKIHVMCGAKNLVCVCVSIRKIWLQLICFTTILVKILTKFVED
jgi:hypothetical protein